jgi:hypothetical protein
MHDDSAAKQRESDHDHRYCGEAREREVAAGMR